MTFRRRVVPTLAAGLLLFTAACGGDDDDAGTDAEPVEETETSEAPADETETTEAPAEETESTEAPADETETAEAPAEETESAEAGTVVVADYYGEVEVPLDAERIVLTDNRLVRSFDDWGVELVAAPLEIFPDSISYQSNDDVADLGNHGEPNLETFVAADPDLVFTGYRFSTFYEDITELVPDATVVSTDFDLDEADPVGPLVDQLLMAGAALGHEDEAQATVDELYAAIDAAKAAYDPSETVMGLITSGGDIGYVAPVNGRAIGPLFPVLGLTPAIEQDGDSGHTGDDISVEAIAAANPDWIIVLDRDASFADTLDVYTSAEEVLFGSEALANVTAIVEGNVVYLPADFYLTEDVMAYTQVINDFADAVAAG